LLITAALEVVAGLISSHSVAAGDVELTLAALSLASMVTSIVKVAHTVLILVWEARQRSAPGSLVDGGGSSSGTIAAASEVPTAKDDGGRSIRNSRTFLHRLPPEAEWPSQVPLLFLRLEEEERVEEDGTTATNQNRFFQPTSFLHHQKHQHALEELISTICGGVTRWRPFVIFFQAEATALDDAGSACSAAQWRVGVSFALSAAQVVACVWLRPMSVRAEFCVSVLLGTLSVVCQAMALGGEVEAAAQVASVASIAEVVFIVLLMLDGVARRCGGAARCWLIFDECSEPPDDATCA
jgi:hypothetical protein